MDSKEKTMKKEQRTKNRVTRIIKKERTGN